MSADRIKALESKLAARTDAEGKPKKGWSANVAAIREELVRLKTARAATTNNTAEDG